MKFYIGTFSDKAIIEKLRESDKFQRYKEMSDEQIKSEVLDRGLIQGGITQFFAKDISHAFKMAKSMQLKNFSQVCEKMYEQGKDYK